MEQKLSDVYITMAKDGLDEPFHKSYMNYGNRHLLNMFTSFVNTLNNSFTNFPLKVEINFENENKIKHFP